MMCVFSLHSDCICFLSNNINLDKGNVPHFVPILKLSRCSALRLKTTTLMIMVMMIWNCDWCDKFVVVITSSSFFRGMHVSATLAPLQFSYRHSRYLMSIRLSSRSVMLLIKSYRLLFWCCPSPISKSFHFCFSKLTFLFP